MVWAREARGSGGAVTADRPISALSQWLAGGALRCSGGAGRRGCLGALRAPSLLRPGRRPAADGFTEPLLSSIHGPRPPSSAGPCGRTRGTDPRDGSVSAARCLVCVTLRGMPKSPCLCVEQGSRWRRTESVPSLAERRTPVLLLRGKGVERRDTSCLEP